MTSASPPFTPEVVAAVVAHMNADHPEDNVLIVRALGGRPDATAARLAAVDPVGAHFEVDTPTGPASATVAWAGPVTERPHIRHEVVRMYQEACAALGVTPRGEGEH